MSKTYAAPAPYDKDEERLDIAMTDVESSQIKSIGHCPNTNTLCVVFKHGAGATYQYPDVSAETAKEFIESESVGRYFGQHIKQMPFKKFAAPKAEA